MLEIYFSPGAENRLGSRSGKGEMAGERSLDESRPLARAGARHAAARVPVDLSRRPGREGAAADVLVWRCLRSTDDASVGETRDS